jgi:4-hydroxybutyrate CoA-transferase
MANWIDEDELRSLVKPGDTLYVGGSTNEPAGLLDALVNIDGLHYIQQPIAAVNKRDLSASGENCTQESYFVTPFLKQGLQENRVRFVPMQMRAIYDHIENKAIDVALLLAARDKNGDLRFGLNNEYVSAAISSSETVIVEVSDAFVSPRGSQRVGDSADYLFASHTPAATFPVTVVDAVSAEIGRLVAGLIRDGDCIQTGIGAVPAAILNGLYDRNDLGLHSGILDEGAMSLIKAGNMNGQAKGIDKGLHITGMVLGSEDLLHWLEEEGSVQFKPANYTHEVGVIRQLDNFVSINSAVEVDLYGQVNAEVVNGQQISGTGGSVDFMRAAKASRGGRSIVALSATARKGTLSRIVNQVEMVTALRTDVDIVVTEFGVAELKSASLVERAQALIQIAHPDFRDQLAREQNEGLAGVPDKGLRTGAASHRQVIW